MDKSEIIRALEGISINLADNRAQLRTAIDILSQGGDVETSFAVIKSAYSLIEVNSKTLENVLGMMKPPSTLPPKLALRTYGYSLGDEKEKRQLAINKALESYDASIVRNKLEHLKDVWKRNIELDYKYAKLYASAAAEDLDFVEEFMADGI
jgi:hypothetical protein